MAKGKGLPHLLQRFLRHPGKAEEGTFFFGQENQASYREGVSGKKLGCEDA